MARTDTCNVDLQLQQLLAVSSSTGGSERRTTSWEIKSFLEGLASSAPVGRFGRQGSRSRFGGKFGQESQGELQEAVFHCDSSYFQTDSAEVVPFSTNYRGTLVNEIQSNAIQPGVDRSTCLRPIFQVSRCSSGMLAQIIRWVSKKRKIFFLVLIQYMSTVQCPEITETLLVEAEEAIDFVTNTYR